MYSNMFTPIETKLYNYKGAGIGVGLRPIGVGGVGTGMWVEGQGRGAVGIFINLHYMYSNMFTPIETKLYNYKGQGAAIGVE